MAGSSRSTSKPATCNGRVSSPPRGRSDLDRLADDGDLAVVGQDIYASGYHLSRRAFAAESGQVLWDRELSSFEGVTADWNNVYSTLETGELVALNRARARRSGARARCCGASRRCPCRSECGRRGLDGYLHFFSNSTANPSRAFARALKSTSVCCWSSWIRCSCNRTTDGVGLGR